MAKLSERGSYYCTKALFACGALHVFSSGEMSKRKQATLGEFGFSKKVCIVKTLNFEQKRWLYTVVAV